MTRHLVVALSLVAATSAGAQEAPVVDEHVKLELRGGRALTGALKAIDADTLFLLERYRNLPTPVARDSVAAFRRSVGVDHAAGARRGAKIGAIAGGVAGLLVLGAGAAYDVSGRCHECFFPVTPFAAIYGGAVFLGSTWVGTVVGALLGRERWSPPLPMR